MKKQLLYLFVGAIALTFVACEHEDASETKQFQSKNSINDQTVNTVGLTPCVVADLMAGQHYDSGDLSVFFDLDSVYIEYKTSPDWHIRKVHLYAGNCALIPVTRNGNPRPGLFPFTSTYPFGTESVTYAVPKTNLPECFCVAAHAEVYRTVNGVEVQTETAWAEGQRFTQNGSWATYFSVCQSDCFDIEDYYFGKQ